MAITISSASCSNPGFEDGPFSISEAETLSALTALRHLAKTASATVGAGTPISNALTEVHLPVPF